MEEKYLSVRDIARLADYTSCYCEENVYRLVRQLCTVGNVSVGFISNRTRSVLLFHQQASQYDMPFPVLWDYHVIALLSLDGIEYVVDLDTRLDRVCRKSEYFGKTFSKHTPEQYRAVVSLTPAHIFLNTFASDRRHMKSNSGHYSSPPPPWKCIRGQESPSAHNLDEWIDGNTEGCGQISPVYV